MGLKMDILKFVLILGVAIAAVICWPIATIWSLNMLFGLAIPVSLDTWLAAFLLTAVINGSVSYRFKTS